MSRQKAWRPFRTRHDQDLVLLQRGAMEAKAILHGPILLILRSPILPGRRPNRAHRRPLHSQNSTHTRYVPIKWSTSAMIKSGACLVSHPQGCRLCRNTERGPIFQIPISWKWFLRKRPCSAGWMMVADQTMRRSSTDEEFSLPS